MNDTAPDGSTGRPRPGPSPTPGERRLAHPPSDRYRDAEAAAAETEPVGSVNRGIAFALGAAALGAAAITLIGGVLAVSAGLLVVAAAVGWAVGVGLRIGARATLTSGRRRRIALALAFGSIALGQLGLWQYALIEGGVLGPIAYLGETFGLLVPLEMLAAGIAAWITAR